MIQLTETNSPKLFKYFKDNKIIDEGNRSDETERLIGIALSVVETVGVSKDVMFVKKEVEGFVNRMNIAIDGFENDLNKSVDTILNSTLNPDVGGSLMNRTKTWLSDKLTDIKTGAVDASKLIIEAAQKVASEDISSIERGIKEVEAKLNPEIDTSYLGMMKNTIINMQGDIEELLDVKHTDSFAYKLNEQIHQYFGDESPLLAEVQSMLTENRKEIAEQLVKLREEVAQRVGILDTMEKTAIKGFAFEDTVETLLNEMAPHYSDIVTRTSLEKGRSLKGDFIYEFHQLERIVIECKDEEIGLKPTLKYLDESMENRACKFSVVVTKRADQLPAAVGGFNLYMGNKLFTSYEYLDIAMSWIRLYFTYMSRPVEKGTVNKNEILGAVESIQNELKNVTNIKTKLTGVNKFVSSENDKIYDIVDSVRGNILIFLNKIESELK